MFWSHFRYLLHFILCALKLVCLSSEGEKRAVLCCVWGSEGRTEDGDVASPCVGYLESFQSGPTLAALRWDGTGRAGLVQSCSSGMRAPASLPILGAMLMAEPGMEDDFQSKAYCALKWLAWKRACPISCMPALKVFFLFF